MNNPEVAAATEGRTDATLAERKAIHNRFDTAETEIMELLASENLTASGAPPLEIAGRRIREAGLTRIAIPAHVFQSADLAFGPSGELEAKIDCLGAAVPPLQLRNTSADPGIPLFCAVLISSKQILALLGSPGPPADQSDSIKHQMALDWMMEQGERHLALTNYKPKIETLIADCAIALRDKGVVTKHARAVRKRLPSEWRRRIGERDR